MAENRRQDSLTPFAPPWSGNGHMGRLFVSENLAFGGCAAGCRVEIAPTKAKDNRSRLFEIAEALGAAESVLACHRDSP